MVMKHLIIFVLLPFTLFAGEFTASVNRSQVRLGDSFTLNLTLKDASARGNPSVNALNKSFLIHSQQQSSNTVIINGQMTTNISWKLTLLPQQEGDLVIPAISIDTSNGVLASEPITIHVTNGTPEQSADPQDDTVKLTTHVSNPKPYKNEPFIYTVRLTSRENLANIKISKVNIEDAIVEMNGEAKVDNRIINGVNTAVIEVNYLITPLKQGPLKIPSTTIQGGVVMKRMAHRGSFMDDDFDPFFMFGGLDRLKPFAMSTEETTLAIQPVVEGMASWVPARSIKIEEIWNESKPIQVGEPITRSFKITAEGIKSSQIPSLKDMQVADSSFKVYADKPEVGDEAVNNTIKSFRTEQYTLIPQKAGFQTLPEITLEWWNVATKEKTYTRVPARTLEILPSPEVAVNENMVHNSTFPKTEIAAPATGNSMLYALIAGLVFLLATSIVWVLALHKRLSGLTKGPTKQKKEDNYDKYAPPAKVEKITPRKNKKEKLPDLNPT